jgi:diguanylate cyclase (GGDEF)-like protein
MDSIMGLKSGDDYKLFISLEKETEALKERLFELYSLYALSKNFNLSLELNDLFSKTIDQLKESLRIEHFCIMLMDEETNELKMRKEDESTCKEAKDVAFKIGEGISGIVAETGEAILIQDVSKDERFLYYKGKIPSIGSFLSLPLKLSDGKTIGVLNIHKRETNAFKEKDKMLFTAIAENVANTIERARLYEKAQRDSIIDGLTTLYTRKYFIESSYKEYSKAERHRELFSIIMSDIDNFKYFNDRYGHLFGDEILKKLASILKSNMRQSDIVARYGGEEFIILLPKTDKDGATLIAEKLRTIIQKTLTLKIPNENIERITITSGVATYPLDGKTVNEIIAVADRFLYFGKEGGRNKVINTIVPDRISKIDEKRLNKRYNTALKIVSSIINQLQSIEIMVNNNWKLCAIKDISKKGFRGEIEFEAKTGEVYKGKAALFSEDDVRDIFSVRIANVRRIKHNRYQFGGEIIDGFDNWNRLFKLLPR